MRLHFQEKPWDLYAAVGYTLVMSATVLAIDVGNLIAIFLVLLSPGYVLVASLFPRNIEIDWIERIALSLGLSIAVVPLLGLFLSFTSFGIRFVPMVVTILIFTTAVGYAAYRRRMREPIELRLSASIFLSVPGWKEYTMVDKTLTVALLAGIVVAGGTLAYVLATPRGGEAFTEFYIFGPGGNASGYPTNLTVNVAGSVIIGVANHEAAVTNYSVRVDLVGVQLVYNATSGFNETAEVNRTTWSWINVTLADGQNWTQPYTFRIAYVGLWKVQFLLDKQGDFSSAYRELHLFVRVT